MESRRLLFGLCLALFAAVLGLAGCGDDDPSGPGGISTADLAGTWNATQFEYSQAEAGPAVPSYDLVAEGGSATLVIQADGSFTLTTVDPAAGSESMLRSAGTTRRSHR